MFGQSAKRVPIFRLKTSGKTAKSKGRVEGDKAVAKTRDQNGKLSADGTQIKWSDGVVCKKVASAADLNGKWIGLSRGRK